MKSSKHNLFYRFIIFLFIFSPIITYAGDLYISPASGSFEEGKIFTATINVRSIDKSMNAASATILFPADKLEIISISKVGSIISFWAEEPKFSNINGTASFEGVVLNPGFIGSTGKLISINFKAKKSGPAYVSFSSGSMLANDGEGSNILNLLSVANWILKPLSLEAQETSPSVNLNKLSGFNIKEIAKKDKTDPVSSFILDSSQVTLEIDHYEISIDNNPKINWVDNGGHIYQSPILDPGNHTIIIKALDINGNYTIDSLDFYVEALKSPKIIDYNDLLESNKMLVVKGETVYPLSKIIVWIQKIKEEKAGTANVISKLFSSSEDTETQDLQMFEVKSDEFGKFIFVREDLEDGAYKLWVESVDDKGARSEKTPPITIIVKPSSLSVAGSRISNFLTIIVPLVCMLLVLVLIILYGYYKVMLTRKRLRKEIGEAEAGLHKAFNVLREDVKSRTQKEDLSLAEKYIEKEIKDIDKELSK